MTTYDCIVVGSGPGGYVAAIRASQLGLRTVVVEKDHLGGRCLQYACIPAKIVLRSADILDEVAHAGEFGIRVGGHSVDFSAIADRRASVIAKLERGVEQLLRSHGVDILAGFATIAADGTVFVEGYPYEAAKGTILACGSTRRALPGLSFNDRIIGTEESWALAEAPDSLAVVGAGPSGVEIASAYARLGAEVVLIEALERVLPSEDAETSKMVEQALRDQGIQVYLNSQLKDVKSDQRQVAYSVNDVQLASDRLVVAAGRRADLGSEDALASLGVDLDEAGHVVVDHQMRTSRAGLWAIGDLVPGPALAHKASEEGIIAAEVIAGLEPPALSYSDIPRVTFSSPNVASVGLTEQQAVDSGYDVTIGSVRYSAVGASAVYGDGSGLVKIVGERTYGELLGAHIVGPRAAELLAEIVTARSLEAGYAEVARVVRAHPTLTEAVAEAARAADGWLIHGAGAPTKARSAASSRSGRSNEDSG